MRELAAQGRHEEAILVLREALKLRPDDAVNWNNLGCLLSATNRLADAIDAFRRALMVDPSAAEASSNLGEALRAAGQHDQAIDVLHSFVQRNPNCVEALNSLGAALTAVGRIAEAVKTLEQALRLRPDSAEAHNNLAVAYWQQGRLDDAIHRFENAVRIRGDWPMGRYCQGVLHLLQGDFERGWALYENRLRAAELGQVAQRFPQPRWDGEALHGQRILLHVEQGFGDVIQFARYAPLVAARGGRVILQCQPQLARLMRSVDGVEQLALDGQPPPCCDMHCPLMSLPLAMKTRAESIPAKVPYVRPAPDAVQRWKSELTGVGRKLKVGLAWGSRVTPDRARTIPSALLLPLLQVGGVRYVSLQKLDAVSNAQPMQHPNLVDLTARFADFADTAAVIANLDLIISVDTAVAHLAGAMGKPTWVLLKAVPDWRWMTSRSDSPWYPTMRLFRQPVPGDWAWVIDDAAEQLRGHVHSVGADPS